MPFYGNWTAYSCGERGSTVYLLITRHAKVNNKSTSYQRSALFAGKNHKIASRDQEHSTRKKKKYFLGFRLASIQQNSDEERTDYNLGVDCKR